MRSPRSLLRGLLVCALSVLWAGSVWAKAAPAAKSKHTSAHAAAKKRAQSQNKNKKRKRRHRRQPVELRGFKTRHEPKVEGKPTLTLEALDLARAKATVRVGGVLQAPAPRMFVFHDDRSRHFIALYARCQPETTKPPQRTDEPAQRCQLDLPRPYLRAEVVGLTVHIRGHEIAADADTVRTHWSEALRALPALPADLAAPAAAGLDPRAAQPNADDEAPDEDPESAAPEGTGPEDTDEEGAVKPSTGDEGEQADTPPDTPPDDRPDGRAEGQAPDGEPAE